MQSSDLNRNNDNVDDNNVHQNDNSLSHNDMQKQWLKKFLE